jgi:hypothetical protein
MHTSQPWAVAAARSCRTCQALSCLLEHEDKLHCSNESLLPPDPFKSSHSNESARLPLSKAGLLASIDHSAPQIDSTAVTSSGHMEAHSSSPLVQIIFAYHWEFTPASELMKWTD